MFIIDALAIFVSTSLSSSINCLHYFKDFLVFQKKNKKKQNNVLFSIQNLINHIHLNEIFHNYLYI